MLRQLSDLRQLSEGKPLDLSRFVTLPSFETQITADNSLRDGLLLVAGLLGLSAVAVALILKK